MSIFKRRDVHELQAAELPASKIYQLLFYAGVLAIENQAEGSCHAGRYPMVRERIVRLFDYALELEQQARGYGDESVDPTVNVGEMMHAVDTAMRSRYGTMVHIPVDGYGSTVPVVDEGFYNTEAQKATQRYAIDAYKYVVS